MLYIKSKCVHSPRCHIVSLLTVSKHCLTAWRGCCQAAGSVLAPRASATGSDRLRDGSMSEKHAGADGAGSGGASVFADEEESGDESDFEVPCSVCPLMSHAQPAGQALRSPVLTVSFGNTHLARGRLYASSCRCR